MRLRRISDAECREWASLVRIPTFCLQSFAHLLERFGNPADALAAPTDIASRMGKDRRIELPSPPSRTRLPQRSASARA